MVRLLFETSGFISRERTCCAAPEEVNDFPYKKYEAGIEGDGASYVEAGEHVPAWLKKSI